MFYNYNFLGDFLGTMKFIDECLIAVRTEYKEIAASPKYDVESRVSVPENALPCIKSLSWPIPLDGVTEAVGNTPVIRLRRLEAEFGLECRLYAKAEFMSVGGSVKDRIGKAMVEDLERRSLLRPGDYVIEATSGNTGIGLAIMCAAKGYNMIVVMPDKMSTEKANVLKALGSEVIRTRTSAAWSDPDSHISIAYKLAQEINNRAKSNNGRKAFIVDQYKNVNNPSAHFENTGEELIQQLASSPPDYFVASVGTGGTLTGVSTRLKQVWPECQIVGVDPVGSILHKSSWSADDLSPYEVEGIGYDFHPPVFGSHLVDRWELVDDKEALTIARRAIATEGLLCGASSGSALAAAIRVGSTALPGQTVVALLPDSIRNYISKFVSDDWMDLHGWSSSTDVADAPVDSVMDDKWMRFMEIAVSIASWPIADFQSDTVLSAYTQCQNAGTRHILVQEVRPTGQICLRLCSKLFLQTFILAGSGFKKLEEVDYRMFVQLFHSNEINAARVSNVLNSMTKQNIQDPVILVVEAGDKSESSPMQEPNFNEPQIDELHTSFTIQNMSQLSVIKAIYIDTVVEVLT
eukprot:Gregarina_sp_Poly_1__331@NODE_107_length_14129_cov_139_662779_g94_i0_p3_GENE_NODE_107_length_14129_cov_139_662779_g94_i0NODE_107_length_14129_cov_139_662779_g94_i0_p3_ORF_typecomplete_len577_score63_67PALP/PF00291_25/6_3e70PALP/PF00291_25/9_5e03TAFII28/PF04719_14/1_5e03TAFII28/PF04719_14/0_51TAFII28/PF04719_14/7_8e03_NODE_107_length_14129_cov_139_662779_g94_i08082538